MTSTTERFVVERDALQPLCDSNAASVLSGDLVVLAPEVELIEAKRQLAETQALLEKAAGFMCSLIKPQLEQGASDQLPRLFLTDCAAFIKYEVRPKLGQAHASAPDGRLGPMEMAARAAANKHQSSQNLASKLLNEPFYQPTEQEVTNQTALHTDIIAFREKYLCALALIDRMYVVHRHEPIFSADDEDIANELGTELLRYIHARDKLPLPRPLVCQQQDTINDLRKQGDNLKSEVAMLRKYEGEWCSLLAVETEEKTLAHRLLRTMSNRMGHEDFGPLCKEIDKFLDDVKARERAREQADHVEAAFDEATKADEEGNVTLRILPFVGNPVLSRKPNCPKCNGIGRTVVMDDDGIWCDTSCPVCHGSGKQIKGDA